MKNKNQIIKESNRLQILESKIRKMVREELENEVSDVSVILKDLIQAQELIEKHEDTIYVRRKFGVQAEREFDNTTRYLGGLIGEIRRTNN